ncbi:MAG: CpsD/CapB family tyrosine-protein kinase [Anaerolineales bacterium]
MAADLITLTQPRSAAAEAYRTLRTNLMFSTLDKQLRRVVVSSPSEKEGKSYSVANLGVVLAQSEHRTLIVDADLRRPVQHDIWNLTNERGLTELLLESNPTQAALVQSTEVQGLSVLTSGKLPPNPADVLASQKMDAVITSLAADYDYLLFDAPPVLVATDAAVLGYKLDGVLLVVRASTTRRDAIHRAQEQFERVGARMLGVVLTNAPRQTRGARYGVAE